MASIPPPHLIGSVLQSPFAQRSQNAERTAEEARGQEVSRALQGPGATAEIEIEATDNDTRVHADAGGQGGSGGRPEEEPGQKEEKAPPPAPGEGGLDLWG